MKLAPLISTPTESISALAAAIVQRHKACMELEADFERFCGERDAFGRLKGERDAWQRLDRTEEPTKVETDR